MRRNRAKRGVRQLREEVDVVVASCHWGVSGSNVVADYQRMIGRAAIEAGADIVIGHHPHVLQEIEIWQGRPIFYSMGNFAFDWERMRNRNLDGLVVYYTIRDSRLADVAFAPARRNSDNFIELLHAERGEGDKIVEDGVAIVGGFKVSAE
ncbi:MAG: CapA family protein [Nitrospinota bacterium]|nr:CapA family protein [Nitrospinota bacterium]MDP7663780.1 CapA family protein [Nitrospinota bacterium]